jgi:hypothetical protein
VGIAPLFYADADGLFLFNSTDGFESDNVKWVSKTNKGEENVFTFRDGRIQRFSGSVLSV